MTRYLWLTPDRKLLLADRKIHVSSCDPCVEFSSCNGLSRCEWQTSAANYTPTDDVPPLANPTLEATPLENVWTVLGDFAIRFNFEDSAGFEGFGNCGTEANPYRQIGVARKAFYVCADGADNVNVDMLGFIEAQTTGYDGITYQIFTCAGSPATSEYSEASVGSAAGCLMGLYEPALQEFSLTKGWYYIEVTVDSGDEVWHNGASWYLSLGGDVRH